MVLCLDIIGSTVGGHTHTGDHGDGHITDSHTIPTERTRIWGGLIIPPISRQRLPLTMNPANPTRISARIRKGIIHTSRAAQVVG